VPEPNLGGSPAIATVAARAGLDRDPHHGAVVPPLHLSSNFTFAGFNQPRRHDYTRSGNPTRELLAEALADLEGGCGSVITASGMAAVCLVTHLLRPGDVLVAAFDLYGGCHRLFSALSRKGAFEVVFTDLTSDDAPEAIRRLRPRLVWAETPSNPLLRLTDIRRLTATSHEVGAEVVVDNTFCSPALQRPIALGADYVLHSTTKYLNGHGDVVGGAVIARDPDRLAELGFWANAAGLAGAPFDAWLTLRGLRTLAARWRVHEENAARVANFLDHHPAVSRCIWPGLPHHPHHALARRQQSGFGAMLAFELHGGLEAARTVAEHTRLFLLAESLGGVESLIAHPATMTHASMDPQAREAAGIGDGLLRLSVGIEAPEDLIADLNQALGGIPPGT
jgi:cystathionine gamma-synthase